MPYVNIKITKEGNVTPEQKRQLIEGATKLLADVLHKNTKTLVVTIDESGGSQSSRSRSERRSQGQKESGKGNGQSRQSGRKSKKGSRKSCC